MPFTTVSTISVPVPILTFENSGAGAFELGASFDVPTLMLPFVPLPSTTYVVRWRLLVDSVWPARSGKQIWAGSPKRFYPSHRVSFNQVGTDISRIEELYFESQACESSAFTWNGLRASGQESQGALIPAVALGTFEGGTPSGPVLGSTQTDVDEPDIIVTTRNYATGCNLYVVPGTVGLATLQYDVTIFVEPSANILFIGV